MSGIFQDHCQYFDEVDFTAEVTVVISSGDQEYILGIGKESLAHGIFQILKMQDATLCKRKKMWLRPMQVISSVMWSQVHQAHLSEP